MSSDKNKKVIVGLSGGVDSAVSAFLLKEQGYEVEAVYLMCWNMPGCRAEEDRKDAMKVALKLNIPFQVIDMIVEYKERVMEYFYREYKKGRTPNPDVLCNREIKFGLFYDWAMEKGYDFMATGHYARIECRMQNAEYGTEIVNEKVCDCKKSVCLCLCSARELRKDQSYFLYQIRQEQLEHVLFPLGNLKKDEVRKIAHDEKLHVADKKDSMGICFVGDVDVRAMLIEKFGREKGEVKLSDGTVVGEHDGYWLYTIGQRGGWRQSMKNKVLSIKGENFKPTELPKLYVIDVNKDENVIVVGLREETLRREFEIFDVYFINYQLSIINDQYYYVKIRNTGKFVKARIQECGIQNEERGRYKVFLSEDEFGVSPGQHCVIYQNVECRMSNGEEVGDNYVVLGGGVIC